MINWISVTTENNLASNIMKTQSFYTESCSRPVTDAFMKSFHAFLAQAHINTWTGRAGESTTLPLISKGAALTHE